MPDPAADIGHLTQLHFSPNGNTAATSYTQILKVLEITYPPQSAEEVDVTDLLDTVVKTQSSILNDAGELSVKFFWEVNNANPNLFYTAIASGTIGSWKIVVPHATPITSVFSGWVKSLTPDPLAQKAPIMNTLVVRCTSLPTLS